jgi:hypothetical protein
MRFPRTPSRSDRLPWLRHQEDRIIVVRAFVQPNASFLPANAHPGIVDTATAALTPIGDNFAPHAASNPNMLVMLDPGHVMVGQALVDGCANYRGHHCSNDQSACRPLSMTTGLVFQASGTLRRGSEAHSTLMMRSWLAGRSRAGSCAGLRRRKKKPGWRTIPAF